MNDTVDKLTDLSTENETEKRPQFGNRNLENQDNVFEHNACKQH